MREQQPGIPVGYVWAEYGGDRPARFMGGRPGQALVCGTTGWIDEHLPSYASFGETEEDHGG